MASHFWTLAVPWMPRCWIAKITSIRMPPMTKVAFRFAVARNGMSKVTSDQLRIAGVNAVTASVDEKGRNGVLRRLAGIGRQPFGDARAIGRQRCHIGIDPFHDGRASRRREWGTGR